MSVVVDGRGNMPDMVQGIDARVAHAAHRCWDVRCPSVILVDSDAAEGVELRRVLMGMGLYVFSGPHAAGIVGQPLLMLCAANRERHDVVVGLGVARAAYPSAPVCVVTGLLPDWAHGEEISGEPYDDGRALLQAAGIGFVSTVEFCDAIAA